MSSSHDIPSKHTEDVTPAAASTAEESESFSVDEEVIKKLTEGVLAPHLIHLRESESQLNGLKEHHRVLIETVEQENTKFGDCQALTDVTDVMDQAKKYHDKLLRIKKEMHMLHDKSAKLKKRALRLQQEKQKEELQREQQRERELERERQLAAKPVKVVVHKQDKVP